MRSLIIIVIFAVCFHFVVCRSALKKRSVTVNNNPIIGILTQEISYSLNKKYPGEYHSYIAASYVKHVESGGARVAPIWIGKSRDYYEDILTKINGVLFPGGATYFNNSDGYAEAGAHIYTVAKQMNDKGIYMPIWGTCLGFELLTYLSANGTEHRSNCRSSNQALPLEFKAGFNNSRLFGSAPGDVVEILEKEHVTPNFHKYCVTEKNLTKLGLDKEWKVLSLNRDWNGFKFISSIEHKKYPFYGLQFHPEKNLYEWIKNKNISHTANAIKVSHYFADFFVNEAKKNVNSFPDRTEEMDSLIYNYSPTFTALKGSSFFQSYLFGDEQDDINNSRSKSPTLLHSSVVLTAAGGVLIHNVGPTITLY